jgi:hypothetical protein
MYVHGSVNVTDQITMICTPSSAPGSGALICNWGQNVVYLGSPTVTSADGYPLGPQIAIDLPVDSDKVNPLHGVCAAGESSTVFFLFPEST